MERIQIAETENKGVICVECWKESRAKEKRLREEFWQSLPRRLK